MTIDGKTLELPDVLSGELNEAFDWDPGTQTIEIKNHSIKREDWLRGKASYGQGRVNLKGALYLASLLGTDLT